MVESISELECAVRHKDDKGNWKVTKRHDMFYASALFVAEETFVDGKWIPFCDDIGDEDGESKKESS